MIEKKQFGSTNHARTRALFGAAVKKEIAGIETLKNNPAQYDRIIIVSPFWAASLHLL